MVRLRGRSRDEDAPRRSTRARRSARTRTPSDVSEDDSDVYSEDERPRARRGRRVTPRDATSEEDDAADEDAEVVEVEGREYRIEDDALVLDTDPAGERKVDAAGHLQGGRTYRVPTFTSPERSDPNRLYMLSIDVARVLGFRDSGYFFRKNPLLHKVLLSTEERDALVADGRLSGPTRNVTMVVARSVFMLMGARIITRGRMVTDDYYEAQARANGCKEGAPVAMPSIEEILRAERRRESDRERERGRRRPDAATHTTIDPQGEAVVTTFGDAGHSPFERAGPWAQRRALLQRADLTEENWMAEYARSVRAMNAEILASRRERLVAFSPRPRRESADAPPSDPAHAMLPSDAEHIRCDTRPPWERPALGDVAAAHERAQRAAVAAEARAREPPIGLYDPHTHMPHYAVTTQPQHAFMEKICDEPDGLGPDARLAGLYTVDLRLVVPRAASSSRVS